MRKLIVAAMAVAGLQAASWAGDIAVPLANEAGLTYSKNYTQNLNSVGPNGNGMEKISAQVVFSSVAYGSSAFTDGSTSTGTFTVAKNVGLLASAATNQITVPSSVLAAAATNQFTIASTGTILGSGATAQITIVSTSPSVNPLVTVNGLTTFSGLAGVNWFQLATTSATAQSLASYLNSVAGTGVAFAWGGGTSNIVYATATINGIPGRSFTVGSTAPTLITTTTFAGGITNVSVTVNGNVIANGAQWFQTDTASGTASALATAINSYSGTQVKAIWGGGTSAVVYSTAVIAGNIGNTYTEASSNLLAISTASTNFTNGSNPPLQGAVLTINGQTYPNGLGWTDFAGTSTGTAQSISALVNSFSVIQSTWQANGVVYATATAMGTAGNAFTLSASTNSGNTVLGGLTIASPNFTNGRDSATITINGIALQAGTTWQVDVAASSRTACNIAAAINLVVPTSSIVISTCVAATSVVAATSTAVGTAVNYVLTSSTQAAITVGGTATTSATGVGTGQMWGGTNSAYLINTSTINVKAHGLTTGLAVTVTTASSVGLSPLLPNVTYYAIVIDTNNVALATTSTGAAAGAPMIVLTSSRANTAADNFAIVPNVFTQGLASGKWRISNDGVNFNDLLITSNGLLVSSATFTPVFPSTGTAWDFGQLNFQYLQWSTLGTTFGGIKMNVNLNGSN